MRVPSSGDFEDNKGEAGDSCAVVSPEGNYPQPVERIFTKSGPFPCCHCLSGEGRS